MNGHSSSRFMVIAGADERATYQLTMDTVVFSTWHCTGAYSAGKTCMGEATRFAPKEHGCYLLMLRSSPQLKKLVVG